MSVLPYFVGGIPEIFQGIPYDFLVRPITPKALSDKIRTLGSIDYRSLRRHIENKFSMHITAKRVKEFFKAFGR